MIKKFIFLFFLFFLFFPGYKALAFSHPGLLNNQAELDLIKAKVAARAEPWYSGYQQIPDYSNWTPQAINPYNWNGSDTVNSTILWSDSRAAYGNALRYLVTGNTVYAKKAIEIINDWSYTTTQITFTDSLQHTRLAIGGGIPQMIWAAEIIRATYSGWSDADQNKFKQFLVNLIYPNTKMIERTYSECVSGGGNNNWGALGAQTRMAVAIYTDRQDYFDEVVLDFKYLNDKTFKSTGKYLETCRCTTSNGCASITGCSTSNCVGCNDTGGGDLEHTQMTLAAMTAMAEMAKKQGVDLYGYKDPVSGNSLLTTLEYHAPFIGYPERGSSATWPCAVTLASAVGQETRASSRKRSFFEMAYNHYRTSTLNSIVTGFKRPEGNIGWADVGWGTLTHTYYGQLSANTTQAAPLTVHPTNPRYFTDGNGKAIYLTGSHTWGNFADVGTSPSSLAIFDFNAYLNFLDQYDHNFIRLWRWELTTWIGNNNRGVVYSAPHPWARTGSTNAADNLPKFNLTQFNQAYFDRLLSRVRAASDHGIYVSVMLFEGNVLYASNNDPWRGHPFNGNNNLNGINGDFNSYPFGTEIHTTDNAAILTIQKNYVAKVLETLKNESNVLYEVGNELGSYAQTFQNEIINYIKTYEASNNIPPHPVGRTAGWYQDTNTSYQETNATMFNTPADWYSPGGGIKDSESGAWRDDPPINDGSKRIISDSDHIGWSRVTPAWVWKSFMRGHNVIFMDPYHGLQGTGPWVYNYQISEANTIAIRKNMGYVLSYANKINLAAMTPSNNASYCSTNYCLRNPGNEYLIYQPASPASFTVNLPAGTYSYEWFSTTTGAVSSTGSFTLSATTNRSFTPASAGAAVLYLKKTAINTAPTAPTGVKVI